jgi:hypothetical protein
MHVAGYPAPPDFRALGGWRLSAGGVPIPPPLIGRLVTLSDKQRAEERFFPDNYEAWMDLFWQRYERKLAAYDVPSPSSRAKQHRRPPPLVERAGPHPRERACAHRGRQLPHTGNAAAGGAYHVASAREIMDAAKDGAIVLVVWVGVEVQRVGSSTSDAKGRQEGAGVFTADQRAQQRHPSPSARGALVVVSFAQPQEEDVQEGRRSGRRYVLAR